MSELTALAALGLRKSEKERRVDQDRTRTVLAPLVDQVDCGRMTGADAVVALARSLQWYGGVYSLGTSYLYSTGYPSGDAFLPWARHLLAELGGAPPAADGADQAVEEVEESVLVTVDEIRDHELANTPDEFWEQPSESVLIAEVSGDELGDDE